MMARKNPRPLASISGSADAPARIVLAAAMNKRRGRLNLPVMATGVEEARARLLAVLESAGGTAHADEIEADPWFSANQEVASAAAHALATESAVTVRRDSDGRSWFPFSAVAVHEADALK